MGVAVITGAASGIGRALALAAAVRGLDIVAADLDMAALATLAAEVEAEGRACLTVRTDVADAEAVDALAEAAYARFGRVDYLFNNAGVLASGAADAADLPTWHWVMGVNLFGVLNGIKAFVPRMRAGGLPGHIVNTASMAGLLPGPELGAYSASKFAVVGLSECLLHELKAAGSPLSVSILCPGAVNTEIGVSRRNAPADVRATPAAALDAMLDAGTRQGSDPAEVARLVFESLDRGDYWIFPHPDMLVAAQARTATIGTRAAPEFRWT